MNDPIAQRTPVGVRDVTEQENEHIYRLLRAVAKAAERVWDTVPAEYGGAKAMVHARALNDMRDALIAAREGGAL